jgi:hypothetical protein
MSGENKNILYKKNGNSLNNLFKKTEYDKTFIKPKPLGIKTPLEISPGDDLFKMHYDFDKVIEDNLKNLIMTEPGERLCFPSFGTVLKNILSRTDVENVDDLLMQEIRRVINIYYPSPLINLISFVSYKDENESNKNNINVIILKINYSMPIVSNDIKEIIIKLGMKN